MRYPGLQPEQSRPPPLEDRLRRRRGHLHQEQGLQQSPAANNAVLQKRVRKLKPNHDVAALPGENVAAQQDETDVTALAGRIDAEALPKKSNNKSGRSVLSATSPSTQLTH